MVSIPSNGDTPRREKISFDRRVTLGNILTIAGGFVWAVIFFVMVLMRLNSVESKVEDIRCMLAQAGIAPTTGACVFAAHQFIEKQLPPAR